MIGILLDNSLGRVWCEGHGAQRLAIELALTREIGEVITRVSVAMWDCKSATGVYRLSLNYASSRCASRKTNSDRRYSVSSTTP